MTSTARRFTLIVNPAAGNGRASGAAAQAQRLLAGGHGTCSVLSTTHLAEAEHLAQDAAVQGRVVVALGGDGMVGRVAAGLAHTDSVMGVLPCGRGNDIARFLGIPTRLADACHLLISGSERRIDLGEVNGRRFVSIASGGIDSVVNAIAHRARVLKGRAVYTYGALRALATWRPATFHLDIAGESITYTGYSFGMANSTTYGGGMQLAPDARVDDGLLDVVTISHMSKLRALRAFPRMYSGTHIREAAVTVRRAAEVSVQADREFMVYADGEPATLLPAVFKALPQALRVLAPSARPTPDGRCQGRDGGEIVGWKEPR